MVNSSQSSKIVSHLAAVFPADRTFFGYIFVKTSGIVPLIGNLGHTGIVTTYP